MSSVRFPEVLQHPPHSAGFRLLFGLALLSGLVQIPMIHEVCGISKSAKSASPLIVSV